MGAVGRAEASHPVAASSTLRQREIGIDDRGRPLPEKSEQLYKRAQMWDTIGTEADKVKDSKYSTWEELGRPNIAAGTNLAYHETPAQLQDAMKQYIRDISKPTPELYFCQPMSPRQLDTAHLGIGNLIPQLDPSQPGMHTGSLNDQKLLRVLWLQSIPEDGDLHPPDPKMVDGRLIAVWKTSTEQQCSTELRKKFERMQGRVADRLKGNKYALEPNVVKRVWGGLKWRFSSLLRGGREGIAAPRNKGRIAAVVLLVSVPTSVGIYAIVYGIQYDAVKHEIYKIQAQGANGAASPGLPPPPYSAVAPPYPALPAYSGSSGNGTTNLSA